MRMSSTPWIKKKPGNLEAIFAGGFRALNDTELQTQDPEFAFAQALTDAGLIVDGGVIADGRIHRCRTEGDRKRRKTGWYVLYLDGVPAGAYGDYRLSDDATTWCAKGAHELSEQELAENRRRMGRRAACAPPRWQIGTGPPLASQPSFCPPPARRIPLTRTWPPRACRPAACCRSTWTRPGPPGAPSSATWAKRASGFRRR
jgi:hypothetical protein